MTKIIFQIVRYRKLEIQQTVQTDVYFDDVSMVHTPTAVLQYNEYYPFGLQTSSSWTRENSSNNFLYNAGSEQNTTTGLYDLPFRNYDPTLGRFTQVDPLATKYASLSGYHYSYNNPVMFSDPSGADPPCTGCPDNSTPISGSQGGGMPIWYSYGPPAWTGDMSTQEWMAYTSPGGMPANAVASMYYSLQTQSIMSGVVNGINTQAQNRQQWLDDLANIGAGTTVLRTVYVTADRQPTGGSSWWYNLLFETTQSKVEWMSAEGLYNWGLREFYYKPQVQGLSVYQNGTFAQKLYASHQRNVYVLETRKLSTPLYQRIAEYMKPAKSLSVQPEKSFWNPDRTTMNVMRGVGLVSVAGLCYTLAQSADNIMSSNNPGTTAAKEGVILTTTLSTAYAGAQIGAGIGALFGGVGAIPGALIGGMIGSWIGNRAGNDINTILSGH